MDVGMGDAAEVTPKKRRGRPKKLQTLAQVQADIDARNQTYRSPITGGLLPVKKSKKVTSLAKGGMDGDDKKKNVDKALEKDFKIDPKMKKAFSDAMALPAKSAAVASVSYTHLFPKASCFQSQSMSIYDAESWQN